MNPEEFNTSTSFPAADIKMESNGQDLTVNHSYAVITPLSDKKDFMVTIRATALKDWRAKLSKLTNHSFPIAEVLLALSSCGVGAFLSALASNIEMASTKGIIFFNILPAITAALLVAYFFVRSNEDSSASTIATSLLESIPNPDNQNSGE
ncbi:hypothetical protein QTU65_002782 [Vibrio vulnificus]|uniref:hypothetical protein n=1 Tax=Vibrio vulnificus TaxID=672 RepID=UPI001028CB05|nr:hypothetical protein [Vibrio vulnificus]EKY4879452.1 hypothetical protein [Vibrio vulnificus]ELP6988300.1 hypothetical protein [Vibrio vulnificus]